MKAGASQCQRWTGTAGTARWNRASFEQPPTTFHFINGVVDLPRHDVVSVQRVRGSAPGIAVAANLPHPLAAA